MSYPDTLIEFGDETLCKVRSALEITEKIKFKVFAKCVILC